MCAIHILKKVKRKEREEIYIFDSRVSFLAARSLKKKSALIIS